MTVFSWDDVVSGKFSLPKVGSVDVAGTALTVGCFDGPHRGHVALFDEVLAACRPTGRREGLTPGVVSFQKPPASLWKPEDFPGLIVPLKKRLDFFQEKGFAFVIVIDFSEKFSIIEGRDFLLVLKKNCGMRFLAESEGFRLGRGAATDIEALRKLASELGFELSVVKPVLFEGEKISSTRIRNAILKGDYGSAELMLGRPVNTLVTQRDKI